MLCYVCICVYVWIVILVIFNCILLVKIVTLHIWAAFWTARLTRIHINICTQWVILVTISIETVDFRTYILQKFICTNSLHVILTGIYSTVYDIALKVLQVLKYTFIQCWPSQSSWTSGYPSLSESSPHLTPLPAYTGWLHCKRCNRYSQFMFKVIWI